MAEHCFFPAPRRIRAPSPAAQRRKIQIQTLHLDRTLRLELLTLQRTGDMQVASRRREIADLREECGARRREVEQLSRTCLILPPWGATLPNYRPKTAADYQVKTAKESAASEPPHRDITEPHRKEFVRTAHCYACLRKPRSARSRGDCTRGTRPASVPLSTGATRHQPQLIAASSTYATPRRPHTAPPVRWMNGRMIGVWLERERYLSNHLG